MTGTVEDVLEHLAALVEDARAVPMSASCVVNRGEVLDLIDEARRALPPELEDARRLLAAREDHVAAGRAEAERLVEQGRAEAERLETQSRAEAEQLLEQGRAEQGRLVEATAVFSRAQAEADRLLEQAHAEAERLLGQAHAETEAMRAQTEDYVDGKLAGFEAVLTTTLDTVSRGRARLSGRADTDGAPGDGPGDPYADDHPRRSRPVPGPAQRPSARADARPRG